MNSEQCVAEMELGLKAEPQDCSALVRQLRCLERFKLCPDELEESCVPRGFLCLWETLFSAPLTSVAINDMCMCVCLSVLLSFSGHGSIAPRVLNWGSSGQCSA